MLRSQLAVFEKYVSLFNNLKLKFFLLIFLIFKKKNKNVSINSALAIFYFEIGKKLKINLTTLSKCTLVYIANNNNGKNTNVDSLMQV